MIRATSLLLAIMTFATFGSALTGGGASQEPISSQPQQQASKECRPNVWVLLAQIGWAYATKSSFLTDSSSPCPDNPPETSKEISEKEAEPDQSQNRLTELPAAEALREARLLFIRPRSSWFNREKLERELLKRKEFGEMGLEITRSAANSELILEITRKPFTTRFTCNFIERTTDRVIAGTTASSLGGEIEPHLAEAIIKQFKAVHAKPVTLEKKPE